MREILFRGKRKDNDEWVKGYYYESNISGCYILTPKLEVRKNGGIIIGDSFEVYEVIPETLGQYTGLIVNGTELFEGDVITRGYEGACNYVVEYDKFYGAFLGVFSGNRWIRCYLHRCSDEFIVIGNIHDSPEFLKEHKK